MVRLITQNLLSCPSRACAYPTNFPLSFRNVTKLEMVEADFNEEFLRGVLSRLEWQALRKSAAELGNTDLPEQSPDLTRPEAIPLDLLKTLHHVLLEIVVADGEMVCPQCEHVYRIKDSIPNMSSLFPTLITRRNLAGSRILTSYRRKSLDGGLPGAGTGVTVSNSGMVTLPTGHRFRLHMRHLIAFLCLISFTIYYFSSPPSTTTSARFSPSQAQTAKLLSYCPHSTSRKHIPTVVLQGTQTVAPDANRTVLVLEQPGDQPAPFLPYAYPPRELRFAQTVSVQDEAKRRPGAGRLNDGVNSDDERGQQLCKVHRVASSPRPPVPEGWKNSSVMFGMSTTPDRVLANLPVWSHWIPSAKPPPLDPSVKAMTAKLPLVLVLTPPQNPTETARAREAMEEANGMGMFVEMRPREAERFETRYFALAEEMWEEAKRREEEDGIRTDWFIFSDDDTFFPDFDSLAHLLGSYDANGDWLIGTLSESTKQVAQWGHIAYGGAGILVSRGIMRRMNEEGVWNRCLAKFGASFGGDAMVTHCAALVMDKSAEDALTLEPTLHQLDIRGDGTGFFQSGFLFTSLHHWGSWFTLFPPWHESGAGDLRKGITLVGKAAKAVGGDNWGRRYVFEGGKVVVALGYSVTIEAKPLTQAELDKSEHTWWEFETFHPIRPGQEEALDKRTYYVTGVRQLDAAGIYRIEHKNREGERVDIIWDQRDTKPKKHGWFS
ncbi:Multifunctional methyltransferase subunit TRM112 [Rhodotorula toruloides]|nr:Multifunctional methyltransferase subunit TRM112 [Rhodotorula toruloides]